MIPILPGKAPLDNQIPIEYSVPMLKTRIKEIRVNLGLSQSDLAKSLGVSKQAVSEWERGGGIRSVTLVSLALVLGCSVEQLTKEK